MMDIDLCRLWVDAEKLLKEFGPCYKCEHRPATFRTPDRGGYLCDGCKESHERKDAFSIELPQAPVVRRLISLSEAILRGRPW